MDELYRPRYLVPYRPGRTFGGGVASLRASLAISVGEREASLHRPGGKGSSDGHIGDVDLLDSP